MYRMQITKLKECVEYGKCNSDLFLKIKFGKNSENITVEYLNDFILSHLFDYMNTVF